MSSGRQFSIAEGWLFGNPVAEFLAKRKDFLLLFGIIGVQVRPRCGLFLPPLSPLR